MSESTTIKNLPPIFTIRKRGKHKGYVLTPHRYEDGMFVVSRTKDPKDYVLLKDESEIKSWIEGGYSLRMSNTNFDGTKSPSLIIPDSIQFSVL